MGVFDVETRADPLGGALDDGEAEAAAFAAMAAFQPHEPRAQSGQVRRAATKTSSSGASRVTSTPAPKPNWTAVGLIWLAGFDFEIKAIARIPARG